MPPWQLRCVPLFKNEPPSAFFIFKIILLNFTNLCFVTAAVSCKQGVGAGAGAGARSQPVFLGAGAVAGAYLFVGGGAGAGAGATFFKLVPAPEWLFSKITEMLPIEIVC